MLVRTVVKLSLFYSPSTSVNSVPHFQSVLCLLTEMNAVLSFGFCMKWIPCSLTVIYYDFSFVADRNVSVLMDLELMATENLKRIAARHNFTFITTTLRGGQLGLIGKNIIVHFLLLGIHVVIFLHVPVSGCLRCSLRVSV